MSEAIDREQRDLIGFRQRNAGAERAGLSSDAKRGIEDGFWNHRAFERAAFVRPAIRGARRNRRARASADAFEEGPIVGKGSTDN